MSIEVMTHVWKHSMHQSGALIVLLAMADHAHDDGGGIFASVEMLGRKARLSGRQVQRVIHALLASKEIERVDFGGGRHQTNTYRILVPWVKGDISSPFQKGDTHVAKRVTSATRKGDTHVTPNRQETSLNRYARRGRAGNPSKASPGQDIRAYRSAASLRTLKDAKAEAEAEIDEILRPGGCAQRIQPTDPAKVARLSRARAQVAALNGKIDELLHGESAAAGA